MSITNLSSDISCEKLSSALVELCLEIQCTDTAWRRHNRSAGKIALSKFVGELGKQTAEPRRINFVELVRPRRRTRYRVTAANLIMRRT